jgi:outer membrane biosynthesis protein TonB
MEPYYRRPWFWALVMAIVAVFAFGVIIAASSPDRERSTTTVVQTPPDPAPTPRVVPAPVIPGPSVAPTPAPPVAPVTPVTPAPPAPPPRVITKVEKVPVPVIRERTVVVPVPESSGTGAGTGTLFRDTNLPARIHFDDTNWQATSTTTVDAPEDLLKEVGTADDGTKLYVSINATEPYQSLVAPVTGKTGVYVQYQRR